MGVYWEEARVGRQGAVSLVMRVCGQMGKVVAGASLEVSLVMRGAVGGGAGNDVREAELVVRRGLV
jgi:hypothetical protein